MIYAGLAIWCALIIGLLPYFRKHMSDKNGSLILGLLVSIGFMFSYLRLGWWGIIPMLIIESAGRLSYAWIQAIVNKRIGSEYRATTLSTLEFTGRIPYIGLNYLAGIAVDTHTISLFHLLFGLSGAALLVVWYTTLGKKITV